MEKAIKDNERVAIDMSADDRMRLYSQITGQMERLGYNPVDFGELDLGFKLPAGWPVDKDKTPLLTQLIAIMVKLNMRIVISNLNMEPMRNQSHEPDSR